MTRHRLNLLIAALAAVVVIYLHGRFVGDARWWNLLMAGLLLALLARYLWRGHRASQR